MSGAKEKVSTSRRNSFRRWGVLLLSAFAISIFGAGTALAFAKPTIELTIRGESLNNLGVASLETGSAYGAVTGFAPVSEAGELVLSVKNRLVGLPAFGDSVELIVGSSATVLLDDPSQIGISRTITIAELEAKLQAGNVLVTYDYVIDASDRMVATQLHLVQS